MTDVDDPETWHEYEHRPTNIKARRVDCGGLVATSHGPVSIQAGDYLAEDEGGDQYPISGEKFDHFWRPVDREETTNQ